MEKTVSFPTIMKSSAVITLALTVVLSLLYRRFPADWIFSTAITAGTTFYHFAMRLIVGAVVPHCVKDPMKSLWFQQKAFEPMLYEVLQVKRWKGRMPTYAPAVFDPRLHTWDEIAQAMCQAEIVHEVIAVLSFLPLFAAIPFGAKSYWVFTVFEFVKRNFCKITVFDIRFSYCKS